MNRKMTRFALAGKCVGRGARGLLGFGGLASLSAMSEAKARLPNPQADWRRRSRREISLVFSPSFFTVACSCIILLPHPRSSLEPSPRPLTRPILLDRSDRRRKKRGVIHPVIQLFARRGLPRFRRNPNATGLGNRGFESRHRGVNRA